MGMAAVIPLASDMEMEVAMLRFPPVTMLMGMELQTESCPDGKRANHQEGQTDEKFRPGRHGLDVGQILDHERDQSQRNHTGRMAGSPGQSGTDRTPGTVHGHRRHRHEMVGTTDHMHGASSESRQERDQHGGTAQT